MSANLRLPADVVITDTTRNHPTRSLQEDVVVEEELRANPRFMELFMSLRPEDREMYYNDPLDVNSSNAVLEMISALCAPSEIRDQIERQVLEIRRNAVSANQIEEAEIDRGTNTVLEMDRKLLREFRTYQDRLPLSIWHCCRRSCFAMIAADVKRFLLFDELIGIHEIASYYREKIGQVAYMVQTRRRGIGKSSIVGSHPTRNDREPNYKSDRRKAIEGLAEYVIQVLPFLLGKAPSRTGVPQMKDKLCVNAVSCLLGVSKNFIYRQKTLSKAGSPVAADEVLESLIDAAGMRVRQHRLKGKRTGYPEIAELPTYDCGCYEPCLREIPAELLQRWYKDFAKCSMGFYQRRKENQYLLNYMMCPLLNRPISYCNNSLSVLFTVSEGRIVNVRRILQHICDNPSLDPGPILEEAARGYRYQNGHPMSRLGVVVREKVENYLDMALRPDPGASDGVNVCRVYSPEINTQEKLRKLLAEQLQDEEVLVNPISSTTLQRMIQEYLDERKCKISFTQSDHNACPNCKSMQYAILQFNMEAKKAAKRLAELRVSPRPYTEKVFEQIESLSVYHENKSNQEDTCVLTLREHLSRDARIRGFLKQLTDFFRTRTNELLGQEQIEGEVSRKRWCELKEHAIITHQDDMTKVDLPSIIINASADITRWRYDINAHVDAVTGNSVVFSHEQGAGPKDASSIFELILLDHILRCRGESIKVIVSDNAAVGKNWLTSIALPQYLVDQGLTEVCIVVFLENNHGKWLADMLFGQLQLRRRRTTIPGIDAILSEFESINKKNGSIQALAVNPLASVDFREVLNSLGYETKAPGDFAFNNRNIHFATACSPGALGCLSPKLRKILQEMLPPVPGVVRICSDPPSGRPQRGIPYERRYFDVPAASRTHCEEYLSRDEVPLVVSKYQPYKDHGSCVVSNRNMDKVGYNGLEFRRQKAFPELHNPDDPLVQQTWPRGLLRLQDGSDPDGLEPINGSENLRCAPENWILRRPVRQFRDEEDNFVARYPPRNMLNAKYQKPPREEYAHETTKWKATATYQEPPFPTDFAPDICAFDALCDLKRQFPRTDQSVTVLDLLRCVYNRMGDRSDVKDPWLHKPVTRPSETVMDAFDRDVHQYYERQKAHPKGPKTVRQFFKADPSVKEKVQAIRRETNNKKSEAEIWKGLLKETARIPGGLDRYEYLVAKDLERYSKELKNFTEVHLPNFDEEHGLLPRASTEPDGDCLYLC